MTERKRLTIEVIGAGTVGGATGRALDDWGHDVVFKDVDGDVRDELISEGYQAVSPETAIDSDLSFVAVPTPYDERDDTMRTEYVEQAVATLADQNPSVVAIRSTVPPGTTERLASTHGLDHFGMVPEFLFADTARQDFKEMESAVLGCKTEKATQTLKAAFEPHVATFVEVTPTEAEFVKFGSNVFAATKISLSNELWRLASDTRDSSDLPDDINPDRVLAGIRQSSPWFGPQMGTYGGWPYGGHCLPKDTKGLRAWAEDDRGVPVPQLSGTIAENDLLRSQKSKKGREEAANAVPSDD